MLDCGTFPQPTNGQEEYAGERGVHEIDTCGQPDVHTVREIGGRRHEELEAARHHADDLSRPTADFDGTADDVWRPGVPLFPQRMAQDGDAGEGAGLTREDTLRIRSPVLFHEVPTDHRLDPEHGEEVGGHVPGIHLNRVPVTRERCTEREDGGEIF